jgi:hypothetical protein
MRVVIRMARGATQTAQGARVSETEARLKAAIEKALAERLEAAKRVA